MMIKAEDRDCLAMQELMKFEIEAEKRGTKISLMLLQRNLEIFLTRKTESNEHKLFFSCCWKLSQKKLKNRIALNECDSCTLDIMIDFHWKNDTDQWRSEICLIRSYMDSLLRWLWTLCNFQKFAKSSILWCFLKVDNIIKFTL